MYERLGSVSATPRQSPTPVHFTHSANLGNTQIGSSNASNDFSQHNLRKISDFSPGPKRFYIYFLNILLFLLKQKFKI